MPSIRSLLRPVVLAVTIGFVASFAARPAMAQAEHGSAPTAAHGATAAHEGGEHIPTAGVLPTAEQGIAPMVISLLVFGVVFAVLATTAWPKIVKGLKDRENKIRSEIEAAENAQRQARQALADYEANLAKARAEANKMLEDAKTQQLAIAADLKAKADAELNAMREKAKRDIESAKRAALTEIYDAAGNMATDIAAKILKREINTGDQQRLVQESLSELQAAVARNN